MDSKETKESTHSLVDNHFMVSEKKISEDEIDEEELTTQRESDMKKKIEFIKEALDRLKSQHASFQPVDPFTITIFRLNLRGILLTQ